MHFTHIALVAALAATASAQTVQYESLTTTPWTHSTGGTWSNGIADTRSTFGKVDKLISATSFVYSRAPLVLQPGTYVADARFAKLTTATGAADITLQAIATTSIDIKVLVAEQTVDEFIHSKALLFTVSTATPVIFFLQNSDTTVTKTDYLFDAFHVGKVERGPAILVESMGRRWGHAWGAPHYCKEFADPTSTFGFVERLNPNGSSNCGTGAANLWWFEWTSGVFQFLPGVHTFNCRIKKVASLVGSHDFDLWVQTSTDGGTTWTSAPKEVWKATSHTLNTWVYSPNLSFDVLNPNHLYRFKFTRTSGSFKADYYFDSFEVRRGENTPFGTSCMNNGLAEMHSTVPQLGQVLQVEVGPIGANTNPVRMILGVTNPALDLTIVGWGGCWNYASLDFILPMVLNSGVATLSIPIPNLPVLIGIPFFTQAYQPTATGLESSNGVRGLVGN